jgi:hypothetical protein
MKVRGFKARVQLSEAELEHVERRPRLSVAPVLAVVIWVGSMVAAAAIQFAWAPFAGEARPTEPGAGSESVPPDSVRTQPRREVQRAVAGRAVAVEAEQPAARAQASEAVAGPAAPSTPQTAATTERDRKIRGSYAGASRDWLAGW